MIYVLIYCVVILAFTTFGVWHTINHMGSVSYRDILLNLGYSILWPFLVIGLLVCVFEMTEPTINRFMNKPRFKKKGR